MRVVLDRHVADVALAVDADRAEIGLPVAAEAVEQGERRGGGLRHRVHEVEAGALVREDVGDEDALVDLEPLLVLLQQLALGVDRGAARELIGEPLGGGVDELGDARLRAEAVGELAVDRLDVVAQALDPRRVGSARHGASRAPPAAGCRARATSLPPSERGSVPGATTLTAIEQPIVSLIRPETRPRSACSA